MAERSKALRSGRSQRCWRGFESHSDQFFWQVGEIMSGLVSTADQFGIALRGVARSVTE